MKVLRCGKNRFKRIAAGLLALVMLAPVFSVGAAAEATDDATRVWNDTVATFRDHFLSSISEGFKAAAGGITPAMVAGNAPIQETLTDARGLTYGNPLTGSTMPEKFDLRDVDGKCYVSGVKQQGMFGACWAFATIAAAEISIMTMQDTPVTEDEDGNIVIPVDLSERHLAWFTYMPQEDGDQKGEGQMVFNENYTGYSTDPLLVLNGGGQFNRANAMLKSGVGVYPEHLAPYQPDEVAGIDLNRLSELVYGKDLNDPEVVAGLRATDPDFDLAYPYICLNSDGEALCWNNEGTWSLPESEHYMQAYQLEEVRILPSAKCGNPAGVNAIKEELRAGRGVTVTYHSDQATVAQAMSDDAKRYIRTDNEDGTWGHFTRDDALIDHAVCIVGWDDTYSADHFNADPELCPPGDGAWICKNSWGSNDLGFPYYNGSKGWGNNGDGYFYLSYFDRSVDLCQSMIFSRDLKDEDFYIGQYDYMVCDAEWFTLSAGSVRTANVFCLDEDHTMTAIGLDTDRDDCTVTYAIYLLTEDHKDPEDGELLQSGSEYFSVRGFRRIRLEQPPELRSGQTVAIVVEETSANVNGEDRADVTGITLRGGANREFLSFVRTFQLMMGSPIKRPFNTYCEGVINAGESFIRVDGVWMDFGLLMEEVRKQAEATNGLRDGGIAVDNFAIRFYAD